MSTERRPSDLRWTYDGVRWTADALARASIGVPASATGIVQETARSASIEQGGRQ